MDGGCRCGFADKRVDALQSEYFAEIIGARFVQGVFAREILKGDIGWCCHIDIRAFWVAESAAD